MPGSNGEPTKEEVAFYKEVLSKARELQRLRSVSPPDTAKIQTTTKEMVDLIESDPQKRFWTKISGNHLKEATDLLRNSALHPDVHRAIEEHLVQADTEALLVEKASVEGNAFNQIMGAIKKNKE